MKVRHILLALTSLSLTLAGCSEQSTETPAEKAASFAANAQTWVKEFQP
ncbi:MAG: outer membrane lipoprotein-sorting protein, partial [Glaciecola sp.]